ncbi:MAG: hypothetical protein ACM3UZ_02080 [Acidobacteriota bacterium]
MKTLSNHYFDNNHFSPVKEAKLGFYDPLHWRYSYTLPIYLAMFLGGRAITRTVFKHSASPAEQE